MGMSVEGIVVLASLPIPVLAALFSHARLYSLYRLLGERWPEIEQQLSRGAHQPQLVRRVSIPKPAGDLSYYWFSFQFQSHWLARQLLGYVDLFSSLPQDLAAQVSIVRRDMKWAQLIVACWGLLFVTMIGLGFRR
jgi:hypothetical protein